jgi:hypothetical protein
MGKTSKRSDIGAAATRASLDPVTRAHADERWAFGQLLDRDAHALAEAAASDMFRDRGDLARDGGEP